MLWPGQVHWPGVPQTPFRGSSDPTKMHLHLPSTTTAVVVVIFSSSVVPLSLRLAIRVQWSVFLIFMHYRLSAIREVAGVRCQEISKGPRFQALKTAVDCGESPFPVTTKSWSQVLITCTPVGFSTKAKYSRLSVTRTYWLSKGVTFLYKLNKVDWTLHTKKYGYIGCNFCYIGHTAW